MSKAQSKKRADLIGRALQIARSRGGRTFPANPTYSQPKPKDMRPKEGERPSFDLLGVGKAEGGEVSGFRDMLEVNPRGWGMGPAGDDEGELRANPDWDAKRDYLLSRGHRDPLAGPASLSDMGQDFVERDMTGVGLAARGVGELAEGDYGQGAADLAMGVGPYLLGPAVVGARMIGRAGAKAAPWAAGGMGVGAMSAAAGESPEDMARALGEQLAVLERQRVEAVKRADMNRPASLLKSTPKTDPLFWEAKGIVDTLDDKIKAISKRLEDFTPAGILRQKQAAEKAEEERKLREASTPFREKYPGVPTALTGVGLGLAAALPFALKGKANAASFLKGSNPRRIDAATEAGEAAILSQDAQAALRSAKEIDNLVPGKVMGPLKEVGKAGSAALAGGALAAETSMYPDQYDAANLPEGPLKDQARERALNPLLYAERGLMGTLTGLSGYKAAGLIPKYEANVGKAKAVSDSIRNPAHADELDVVRRNIASPVGGAAIPGPRAGGALEAEAPRSIAAEMAATRSAGSPGSVLLETSTGPTPLLSGPQGSPELSRALNLARSQAGKPTSSRAQPSSTPQSATDSGPKILRKHKDRVLMKDSSGKERWRFSKGNPDGGNFASSPFKGKSKANKGAQQPKDDGPPMDENGNWVKTPKEPEDRFSSGGHVQRLLGMARRYATGGAVSGALVGSTGGREDKLKTQVAPGSHIIPADVVSHHGQGNTMAGFEVMKRIFGDDDPPELASGGAVPVYLSDGEYAVTPRGVERYGGHDKVDQFILASRQQAIETLKNLPPPAK